MKTILVIDDDRAHGQTVSAVLESRFQVHVCESAEEALELITQLGDLYAVISDLDLRGANGANFLEQLKGQRSEVRRVLMSARFSHPDFDLQTVSGAEAHVLLAKPISVKDLRNAV